MRSNAMTILIKIGGAMALLAAPISALAKPVELGTKVLVEPAAKVMPGDRVVYQISYRNSGSQVAGNVVITNPVPRDLVYAGAAGNSPEPELSADGVHFGTLAQLSAQNNRPVTAADIRIVRWHLNPIPGGGSGQVAFRAMLK
jgi:uncharacterized repeat protein (TIGR01451 family)